MIGSEMLRYDKQQKYLIADYEAESLNLYYARPWQCAWMICTLNEVLEKHDHYPFFADLEVSRVAAQVTKFNLQEYKERAEDARGVLDKFESYLFDPQYIIIFHNGLQYDTMVHQTFRRQFGLPRDYSYQSRFIDTNAIAKAFKKNVKPPQYGTIDFLAFQFRLAGLFQTGLKSSLTNLGKEFEIEYDYDNLHRGINDIGLNYLVWKELVNKIEISK